MTARSARTTAFPPWAMTVAAMLSVQLGSALAMDIVDGQWTVKIRDEGPGEPADRGDVPADLWTGVLPIKTVYGEPQPASRRAAGHVALSPSIYERVAAQG